MSAASWIRVVLCGFVAGVIWHVLDAAFLAGFAPDLLSLSRETASRPGMSGLFFFWIDLAMGVWAVWLYSAIAPRYGRGPATGLVAGVAWWLLKTLQSAKWAGLGFVALDTRLLPVAAATLIVAALATVTGAWLYENAGADRVSAGGWSRRS